MLTTNNNTLPLFDGPKITDCLDTADNIVLNCGDTLESLQSIPSNFCKLIVTSPPYNLGKEYEDRTAIEGYLDFQKKVITQLVRTLRSDGSLCWQVGNFVEDFEVFPLDILYYEHFKKHGLKLRNRIIWRFNKQLCGYFYFSTN